jgi:hypothetical protein
VDRLKALKGTLEDYLGHFPAGLSVDNEIEKYADNEALGYSKYIFIHREGKQQYGYCTHCKMTFKTSGALRHNMKKVICPSCLSDCKVKSTGMGRGAMIDEVYFVYYEKSIIDPNVIVARGFYAVRDYRDDYTKVQTKFAIQAFYVFEPGNGAVMFRREWIYYRRDWAAFNFGKFIKSAKIFTLFNVNHNAWIPNEYSRKSIKMTVKDTTFKYSTWENYNIKDMTEFFGLYSFYPCVEYLTKLGMTDLVRDKLIGEATYGAINWRGKTLLKVLRLTKQEFNEIKKQNIYVSFDFLKILQASKKNNWGLSIGDARRAADDFGNYYFDIIKDLSVYAPVKKILKYITDQKKHDSRYYDKRNVVPDFRDYVEKCIQLNMDSTNERVLFPKSLHEAHKKAMIRIKLKNNKKFDKQIKDRVAGLNKRFYFEYKDLLIRPAANYKEFIAEGNDLLHCVADYAGRHAMEKTTILFIRKISEPQKSFYTVEIANQMVVQVKGFDNCPPAKDVFEFMQAFQAAKLGKKTRIQISA